MSFRDTVAARLEKWMADGQLVGKFYEKYTILDRGDENFIIKSIDGYPVPTLDELRNLDISDHQEKKELKSRKKKVYTSAEVLKLTPEEGDIVYNSSTKNLQFFNGIRWVIIPGL